MAMETIAVPMPVPEVPAPPAAVTPTVTKAERDTTKWLHKTKLCVYSIQGSCRLGSKCSFAHNPNEVQEAPNLYKTQLCSAFAAGNCTKENCPFAHGEEELRLSPNFKNKICKWFGKGLCRNGEDCSFAHGVEQLRGRPRKQPEGETPAIPPPPGLSLAAEESAPKAPLVLDGGLLDAKMPPSNLELQLEGMTASITNLQKQMDDMVLRTQVSSMKQYLGQLTAQVSELEQSLSTVAATPADPAAGAPWRKKKTPLKTALSSKATPFQPVWNAQAMPFMPNCAAPAGETNWSSDDSTSIPSDSGGGSSD